MNHRLISTALFAATFFLISYTATAQNNDKLLAANATGKTTYPSHYKALPKIAEKDMTNYRRIWKEINQGTENSPSNVFYFFEKNAPLADVLANGVSEGKFTAYSNVDDRFTHALTKEEFSTTFGKTSVKNTKITGYQVKEDSIWINTGEVTVRIIGIAPTTRITGADGTVKDQPLFWIFYPDCREYLASKPIIGAASWYDFLERQYFTGKVIKVNDGIQFIKNPKEQPNTIK